MLAYQLICHKNPKQVSRLMHAIYSSDDFYQIAIFGVRSSRERAEWMNYLNSFERSNVSFTFGSSNAWGTFELVKTTLDAMEHFKDSNYSHFINLSGQCYPIKPIRSIKETLSKNRCSYMDFNKMPGYSAFKKDRTIGFWTAFVRRFEYCYYPVPNWHLIQPLKRLILKERPDVNIFVKIPRLNKKLLRSFDLYFGSGWFCLHKDHVEYVLGFIKDNPDYNKFFSKVLIADEHFFQTILLNSSHKSQIVKENYRYMIWPGPKILSTEDINDILSSNKLFARKFDTEMDSNVLDILDQNNKD